MVRAVCAEGRGCRRLAALALTVAAACLGTPPDAPPDDPPGADAAIDPDCDLVFGGVRGYLLCGADEASCTFFVNLDGEFTCAIACEEFGVACLAGFDNSEAPDNCAIESEEGCDALHSDQICVCARPGV